MGISETSIFVQYSPWEVIEVALAHVVRNRMEAAYARSDLFERRRLLMEEWACHCQRSLSPSIEVHK